jgi:hypothetical protein
LWHQCAVHGHTGGTQWVNGRHRGVQVQAGVPSGVHKHGGGVQGQAGVSGGVHYINSIWRDPRPIWGVWWGKWTVTFMYPTPTWHFSLALKPSVTSMCPTEYPTLALDPHSSQSYPKLPCHSLVPILVSHDVPDPLRDGSVPPYVPYILPGPLREVFVSLCSHTMVSQNILEVCSCSFLTHSNWKMANFLMR